MLANKNAIVTGATRGIGRTIAIDLAKNHANVIISGRNEGTLIEACETITKYGVKSDYVVGDVQDFNSAQALVNKCISKFGTIDILINNAGITRDNLLMRMKEKEWDDVININLKGTYNTIRAAAKKLMKQRFGKIINITSVVGVMGNAGQANYAASKAGVIGLTKSVAKEMAPRNITANAVAPGYISTEMTDKIPEDKKQALLKHIPLARLGHPQSIADIVTFLSSEKADYITGQIIHVDGGILI